MQQYNMTKKHDDFTQNRVVTTGSYAKYAKYIVGLIVGLICYYSYLDSLYIIDEVYNGDKLREYTIQEKTTIRVEPAVQNGKYDFELLNNFIGIYSICQNVHEIQILWPSLTIPPPKSTDFVYPKTHSLVTVDIIDPVEYSSLKIQIPVMTESIFLLDLDIRMTCEDLRFTHSVWRSSKDSLVGYFPHLHTYKNEKDIGGVVGYSSVLWKKSYSLLLTSAVMMKQQYLQSLSSFVPLQSYLKSHNECSTIALSLYAASIGATPPIYAEIPTLSIDRKYTLPPKVSSIGRDKCIEKIAKLLNLNENEKDKNVNKLTYSSHKAVPAKSLIFW